MLRFALTPAPSPRRGSKQLALARGFWLWFFCIFSFAALAPIAAAAEVPGAPTLPRSDAPTLRLSDSPALLRPGAPTLPRSDALPSISLSQLQASVAGKGSVIQSFRVEGVVCAVLRERNQLVLQDASGTILLELPVVPASIAEGQLAAVEGMNCALARGQLGLRLGTAPVVNNDGHHANLLKTGDVFLNAGMQPLRLEWFNGKGGAALKLEFQGLGLPRQKIPAQALWRGYNPTTGQTPGDNPPANLQPGLDYAAFEGDGWRLLPDFGRLRPVRTGIAENFDIELRTRPEDSGLVFSGYLNIQRAGTYTFSLESDDGSQLQVGDPCAACKLVPLETRRASLPQSLSAARSGTNASDWVEFSGEITFCAQVPDGLQLDLKCGEGRVPAVVLGDRSTAPNNLLHREVRGSALCEFSSDEERRLIRLIVPGPDHLQAPWPVEQADTNILLTAGERVRQLKREESRKHLSARLRGVVIWSGGSAFVLHDGSGGVYIHFPSRDWTEHPQVGQFWEVEGTTDPGDFSPVLRTRKARFLGNAPMPEPIRPGWDQLMNGSLDAEYVELRGVITSATDRDITLMTPDGRIRILAHDAYPLPMLPDNSEAERPCSERPPPVNTIIGSVVRIRGCLTAEWDSKSGQVKGGEIHLAPSAVCVDEPAPADPFDLPLRKAADLLRFDARGGALQRVRVAGQIIYAAPHEYCLWDGQTGVRLWTHQPPSLRAGDLVEAVGFPRLGEASPMLQDAQIRKTGRAILPDPLKLVAEELVNSKHDSQMVRFEADLVNDTIRRNERVLEVQSGSRHFLARLNTRQFEGAHPIQPGSRLQLTGVYRSFDADGSDAGLDSFQLLLNNAAAIEVLREPPWWTARRAIGVAAALAGGLAVAAVWITLLRRKVERRTVELRSQIEQRQILEQRRAMEQERTRVAQDLHDELGAGLTEVSILGSLARNPAISTDKRDGYLNQLTEAARTLITGLDEIVWAINPQYDSVGSLATYYALFAQRFLDLAHIACRLEISENLPDSPLDAKVRHGIFLAFKEALNNVVRHSGATEVRLKIEVAEKCLSISIADNGSGFRSNGHVAGKDGIAGMRLRMRGLGGECHVYSGSGRGALVRFRLPVDEICNENGNGNGNGNGSGNAHMNGHGNGHARSNGKENGNENGHSDRAFVQEINHQ